MSCRNVTIHNHEYLAVTLVTQAQFAVPPHQPSCCVNSLIIVNETARASLSIIISSNKREWNNCFIKNNQEILLYLADFALKKQPLGNLMVAISRAW